MSTNQDKKNKELKDLQIGKYRLTCAGCEPLANIPEPVFPLFSPSLKDMITCNKTSDLSGKAK